MLGLAGNDHTRRLEEMQDNPQNNAIGEAPDGAEREIIPLEKETLSAGAGGRKEYCERQYGNASPAAQTYADVDDRAAFI